MIHTLEWTVGMVHFPVMLEINENEKMPCDGKEVMAANIEKSKLLLSPQQNDSDALKMMFIDPILQANWNGEEVADFLEMQTGFCGNLAATNR